jgi:hypothetical protein
MGSATTGMAPEGGTGESVLCGARMCASYDARPCV